MATDFEHRSFAQEFALCQRYYQSILKTGTFGFMITYRSGTRIEGAIRLPVPMRATPSLVQTTGSNYYTIYPSTDNFNGFTGITGSSNDVVTPYADAEVSGTAGYAGNVYGGNASSSVALGAEL